MTIERRGLMEWHLEARIQASLQANMSVIYAFINLSSAFYMSDFCLGVVAPFGTLGNPSIFSQRFGRSRHAISIWLLGMRGGGSEGRQNRFTAFFLWRASAERTECGAVPRGTFLEHLWTEGSVLSAINMHWLEGDGMGNRGAIT